MESNPTVADALGQAKTALESLKAALLKMAPELTREPCPCLGCRERQGAARDALAMADAALESIEAGLLEFTTWECPEEAAP